MISQMRLWKYSTFLTVACILIFIFFRSKEGPTNFSKSVTAPAWTKAPAHKKPVVLFSKLAEETLLANSDSLDTLRQTPQRCVDQWSHVTTIDVKSYLEAYKKGSFGLDKTCISAEQEIGFSSAMYAACEMSTSRKITNEKDCLKWLKLYKAYLIDKFTLSERDYSKLPVGILVNKFIGRMSVYGETEIVELRKMAEQIKFIQPDNPSSYKILAATEMISSNGNPKVGADFAEAGLLIDPADLELQSAWFYFKAKDPNFKYFVDQNPQYSYGRYFEAAILWKEGQRQSAINILNSLIQEYPTNEHFKATLVRAQESTSATNPFSVSFDVSKDNW